MCRIHFDFGKATGERSLAKELLVRMQRFDSKGVQIILSNIWCNLGSIVPSILNGEIRIHHSVCLPKTLLIGFGSDVAMREVADNCVDILAENDLLFQRYCDEGDYIVQRR